MKKIVLTLCACFALCACCCAAESLFGDKLEGRDKDFDAVRKTGA